MIENLNIKEKLVSLLESHKKDKKNVEIISEIAKLYKINNDNLNHINFLKKNYDLDKSNYKILNNLGTAYKDQKKYKIAQNYFFKSISINKDYLIGNFNLALLLEEKGHLKNAAKYYLKVINIDKDYLPAYYNLYRIDKNYFTDEFFKNIINLLENKKLPTNKVLSYGYFLLARREEERKNFQKEVEYLEKGHDIFFNSSKKNKNLCDFLINHLPSNIEKFHFDEDFSKFQSKFQPIFIFGLPRSGTTLVEALITSGKEKIDNFGETSVIYKSLVNLEKEKKINITNNFKYLKVKDIYDQIYKNYNIDNSVKTKNYKFIDRSMENFLFYKIIFKIFPHAKIIHCHRNYFHNFVAIFKQCLENLIWTHSKEYIVKYINLFESSINQMKKKYPKNILTVNLKELTNEPEKTSKILMKFCGLKWSKEILNFYDRSNMIVTSASNIQIRKKIYTYNENIFDEYEKYFLDYFSNNYK